MKLLSFRLPGSGPAVRLGALVDDGRSVVDLTRRLGPELGSLRRVLDAGALTRVKETLATAEADHALADVVLAPTVPDPDKILCIGLNYRSHVAEMTREMPRQPSVFSRLHNTLNAHGGTILRPRVSDNLDYEGELAMIVGRRGRYIAEADALSHIAGYSIFNDGSIRDFQKHAVTAGKNFPGTGALGPWMVTADELGDPTRLTLSTRLNGQEVQHSTTDQLIYGLPVIVAYLSTFTELLPGDVIATGTPEGVGAGRTPPLWMKPGDTVEVEISGIGILRNHIAAEM